MNSSTRQLRLHLRNWRLILASFWVPIFLLVPMAVFVTHRTQAPNGLTLMTLIGFVCASAFFLATAQQEMLHRPFTFLLPGFRRSLLNNQVAGMGFTWVGTLILTMFLPVARDVPAGNLAHAWSFGCLAVSLFALVLLTVFRFPYSSWLPFNAIWMLFLFIRFWLKIPGEAVIRVLDLTTLISALTGLIVYLVVRNMGSASLHRNIIERPYISIVDLKSSDKIEQFKQARAVQKGGGQTGRRPLAGLIQRISDQTARTAAAGEPVRVALWEALYLQAAIGIPRSRVRLFLLSLFVPLLALILGYYDSRLALGDDTTLVGWFPGLVFTVSLYPMLAFTYIKTRPLGRLRSRGTAELAGYQAMGWLTLAGMALSLGTWLVFLIYDLMLPDITLGGRVYSFGMPLLHLIFLPLMTTPVMLLVFIPWRNQGTFMVLQQTGTLAFFVIHGALTMLGYEVALWPVVGLCAACWLALPFVWRWRIRRTDLA